MEMQSSKHTQSQSSDGATNDDVDLRCPQCNRPFTRRDHLQTHVAKIHDTSAEKAYYLCPMPDCTSRSLYASNWRAHLKSKHKWLDTDVKKLDAKNYQENQPSRALGYLATQGSSALAATKATKERKSSNDGSEMIEKNVNETALATTSQAQALATISVSKNKRKKSNDGGEIPNKKKATRSALASSTRAQRAVTVSTSKKRNSSGQTPPTATPQPASSSSSTQSLPAKKRLLLKYQFDSA